MLGHVFGRKRSVFLSLILPGAKQPGSRPDHHQCTLSHVLRMVFAPPTVSSLSDLSPGAVVFFCVQVDVPVVGCVILKFFLLGPITQSCSFMRLPSVRHSTHEISLSQTSQKTLDILSLSLSLSLTHSFCLCSLSLSPALSVSHTHNTHTLSLSHSLSFCLPD